MRVAGLFVLLSVCLGESETPGSEPVKKSNLVVSSTTSQLPFYLRQEPVFKGPQDQNPEIKWEPLRRDIYAHLRSLGSFAKREVRAIRYIMDEDLDKNRDWSIGLLILLEIAKSPGYYTPVYFASDLEGKTEDYDVSNVVETDVGPALMIRRKPQYAVEEWQVLSAPPGEKSCKVTDLFTPDDPLAPLSADGWTEWLPLSKSPEPKNAKFDPMTFTRKFSIVRKKEADAPNENAIVVVKYRWKDGQLTPEKPLFVNEP